MRTDGGGSHELREIAVGDGAAAWRAMLALRPGIGDAAAFSRHVDDVQRPEGYRLLGAFERSGTEAVAVAGFRVVNHLAWGRALYVDDLSTLPEHRGRGHGGALLSWLIDEGTRLGCGQLHLDSGVGPERADAHRLYLNHGLRIASHHFLRDLRSDS